jgi:hypothetical protein
MAFSREGLSDLLDDAYILAAQWPDGDAQGRGAPIDKQVPDHCGYEENAGYDASGVEWGEHASAALPDGVVEIVASGELDDERPR